MSQVPHKNNIKVIQNDGEYQAELAKAGGKLVVVDFTASWCGPCKMVHPHLVRFSMEYTDVVFLEVDVDRLQSVAAAAGVSSMPTFHFLKGGQKIKGFSGADVKQLEATIKELRGGEGSSAFEVPEETEYAMPTGMMDLAPFIDMKQVECGNESDDHPAKNLFSSSGYLASDCDEELLLHIPFNQPVRLHSIKFTSKYVIDDLIHVYSNPDKAPKDVKLFINTDNLDFDDAVDAKPTQMLQLNPDDYNAANLTNVKYVLFQNTRSVTLFISSNQGGDDVTVLSRLSLIGMPATSMNMANWKPVQTDE